MTSQAPIEIIATRAGEPESRHLVHAVVASPGGDIVEAMGNAERPVFPRSSIKAMQALPLVESGAADAFQLSEAELALACASHEAEARHVDAVTAWLARLGLEDHDLACGPQWPRRFEDQAVLIRAGHWPVRRHNNCSGKHCGMLATALHMKESTAGYHHRRHPVQERVFRAISELTGYELHQAPFGIDGCSAPNPLVPLTHLAVGAARFAEADAARLGSVRAEACRRLAAAMTAHPEMVGGSERVDTDLIGASGGRIISKTGAEGVYLVYVVERGLGIALKAEDGAPRAAAAALWTVLDRLGLLDATIRAALRHHCRPEIRNWDGLVTGSVIDAAEL